DFEGASLARDLAVSGFAPGRSAMVSWLAVTPYLTTEAISATLAWFNSLAPGSELVFTYMDRAAGLVHEAHERRRRSAGGLSDRAPSYVVRSAFTKLSLRRLMIDSDVTRFRFVPPDELEREYLSDRDDGLSLSGWERLVVAHPNGEVAPTLAS